MPNIDLSILNQRQTPAFYADVLANRPSAGFVGRIFVSTDTYAFYRDNGTSWDLIGGPGTGTVTGTGANGQVTFWNGASTITGSNDLFWDATNGHLGVNTNAPGTALDVHHDQPTVAILNQTVATNDTRIGFQNNGVGLWRIGAFYNAGANDFGIYDAVAAIQPVTVKKTTGQVLIGTSTVGSGKLVVASASSDNGIQIVGATAPSLRIDSAESGPTKRAGLGISTATNNFIQGSADRDFCIFNGSTAAASPILFGVYDAGATNVQEAARISAARNFLIGTTTDAGYKLAVSGTINAAGTISSQPTSNANGLVVVNGSSGSYGGNVTFQRGGTQDGVIGTQAANNTIITGATNADICILADGGGRSIRFSTTNASPQFTLASGGSATFAGKVNVVKSISDYSLTVTNTDSNGYGIYLQAGGTNNVIDVFNAAGTTSLFNLSGIGVGTFSNFIRSKYYNVTGSNGLAGYLIQQGDWAGTAGQNLSLVAENGLGISFFTNGQAATVNMFLASTGNLLIGTTSDNGTRFQVFGGASLTTNSDSVVDIFTIRNNSATSSGARQRFQNGFGDLAAIQAKQIDNGALADDGILEFQTASNSVLSTKMSIKNNGQINIASIATSSAGLVSGDIWSNAGVLTIVP